MNNKIEDKLNVFGYIFRINRILQMFIDYKLDDLSTKQWYVLMILSQFKYKPNLRELADACDTSYQNVKQILLKLETKNFVRLIDDKSDKRHIRVEMNKDIAKWRNENKANQIAFIDKIFNQYNKEDVTKLNTLLEKMYLNIKDEMNINSDIF